MTSTDMASRLQKFKSLIQEYDQALQSFKKSNQNFRILKSAHPHNVTKKDTDASPKTLFILDSSFNPPSTAHRTLAKSILAKSVAAKSSAPQGLLLLFSTMNADKAPSAASFPHRLAMMTIFAHDLLDELATSSSEEADHETPRIDIGVTTAPYYTDKSAAIQAQGGEWYPDNPKHVHLLGFDTLTRFFGAKYYKDFSPPFSALDPFFAAGHRLRVTERPDGEYGSVEMQEAFLARLAEGEMEADGGKREWAKQVELVPPNPQAGVSSTKIRKAAKAGEWEVVRQLCTPGVAAWVEEERLYEEDAQGAKMA